MSIFMTFVEIFSIGLLIIFFISCAKFRAPPNLQDELPSGAKVVNKQGDWVIFTVEGAIFLYNTKTKCFGGVYSGYKPNGSK